MSDIKVKIENKDFDTLIKSEEIKVKITNDENIIVKIHDEVFSAIIKEEAINVKINESIQSPVLSINGMVGNVIIEPSGIEQYINVIAFPNTGKTDILYIAIDTNLSYIWTGSVYVKVGDGADTVWGDITGTLADQTDLQEALDSLKIIVDTRQNIFTQTPANGTEAFATDTKESFKYIDGWQQESTLFKERTGSMDMGSTQESNLGGYGRDYITHKSLADVTIGGNSETKEGGVRTIFSQTLQKRIAQYYLNGDWRTALTGISIQTDNTESTPDIEFTDFEPYRISLITGNSDLKDINGVPTIQNMKTDMGAFQSPLEINGGIL